MKAPLEVAVKARVNSPTSPVRAPVEDPMKVHVKTCQWKLSWNPQNTANVKTGVQWELTWKSKSPTPQSSYHPTGGPKVYISFFSAVKLRFRHRANHFTKKWQRNIWSNINWSFNSFFKNMPRHKIFFEHITKYDEWRQEPPKMRKSSDRGTKSEPMGTKSEPKGSQRQVNCSQNSTKTQPNRAQRVPKVNQNASKDRCSEKIADKCEKTRPKERSRYFAPDNLGSHFPS